MKQGEFFENYFYSRDGKFHTQSNGEANVLCPFPHDKGYETRPSAHVNVNRGVFHCKTCQAEGRHQDGGLSEIAFFTALHNTTYEQAIQVMTQGNHKNELVDPDKWQVVQEALHDNPSYIDYLHSRGISDETILEYQLGYMGDGIGYPVWVYGQLLDVRTYSPDSQPKMRSQKGASPLLFPFDTWVKDERDYTLLCAGENDALLARQFGFNALTVTGGEGNFPKLFAGLFGGKKVYIAYDCDEAGRKGGAKVAFLLKEAGATVKMVDLGLPGTKDDKDITDFFTKHNHTSQDLFQLLENAKDYTQEDFQEAKNNEYPLVDLWNVAHGEYSGKRLSSRVIMSGKFDLDMRAPSAAEWKCPYNAETEECNNCRLKEHKGNGWWTLNENNLDEVLELVEVNDGQQHKALRRFIGFGCDNGSWIVKAKQRVQKVTLIPDVETESEVSGFRSAEMFGYVLGHVEMEDSQKYRVFFKGYEHPLQRQAVVVVIDKAEDSDNPVNSFKMTPELMEQLKQFQGDPKLKMKERHENAKKVIGNWAQEMVVYATDLMYHSVLQFRYKGQMQKKGYPEILVVGDTRTGKTKVAQTLQEFYGMGNFTECKTASVAGILGGVDKLPSGANKVRWGIVPLNHKGLVIMDELSGMPREVMSALTGLRSGGVARLTKIGSGAVPAKTRLLWISNQRVGSNGRSKSLYEYPTGVEVVLDLVGSAEDIARFDAVMLIPQTEYINDEEHETPDRDPYRHLIHWVWSRTADQITWDKGVEDYVWQVSQELNEKYDCDVRFFGAEARWKLARLAIACAGACFSSNSDGDCLVVRKSHVDWAADFLVRCYDNNLFRLPQYVNTKKVFTSTTEEVNQVVAAAIAKFPMVLKQLAESSEASLKQLEMTSGMDNDEFKGLLSSFARHHLIQLDTYGIRPTLRFRLALDAYRRNYQSTRMIPLSEQGGAGV